MNVNNERNFEEIDGHIKILSAKLTQLTDGQSSVADSLENLTDYYERALQLRIYQVNTLHEEKVELEKHFRSFVHSVIIAVAVLVMAVLLLAAFFYPAAAVELVYQSWTHLVVAAATAAIVVSKRTVIAPTPSV